MCLYVLRLLVSNQKCSALPSRPMHSAATAGSYAFGLGVEDRVFMAGGRPEEWASHSGGTSHAALWKGETRRPVRMAVRRLRLYEPAGRNAGSR